MKINLMMKLKINQNKKDNLKELTRKILLAILLLANVFSFAQIKMKFNENPVTINVQKQIKNAEKNSYPTVMRMSSTLGLDTEQQEQIKRIVMERSLILQDIRNKENDTKGDLTGVDKDSLNELRSKEKEDFENKLMAILTLEQIKLMKESQKGRRKSTTANRDWLGF